jgi:hypothetical protein
MVFSVKGKMTWCFMDILPKNQLWDNTRFCAFSKASSAISKCLKLSGQSSFYRNFSIGPMIGIVRYKLP